MNATKYLEFQKACQDASTAILKLDGLQAKVKNQQLRAADGLLPELAELTVAATDAEARVKKLSQEHYDELFTDEKRSHKTPFGTPKFTKSTTIEFIDGNEEKVLLLIERECGRELDRAAKAKPEPGIPTFTREQLVRTKEEPKLEAFENFDDATLARFGLKREHKDNFSFKPFDMETDKPGKKAKAEKGAKA